MSQQQANKTWIGAYKQTLENWTWVGDEQTGMFKYKKTLTQNKVLLQDLIIITDLIT